MRKQVIECGWIKRIKMVSRLHVNMWLLESKNSCSKYFLLIFQKNIFSEIIFQKNNFH
jgi:hypothetical protein